MPYLIIERPDTRPQKVSLTATITLGRSKDSGIWISDGRLSREHCRLELRGDGWFIVDLGSSNGTRINGQPITDQRLEDGTLVEVGDTILSFRSGTFVQRPADPIEAARQPTTESVAKLNHGSTVMGTHFAKRVLPTEPADASDKPLVKPLAFTRPPARPLVESATESARPTEGSHWFKSLVARLLKN